MELTLFYKERCVEWHCITKKGRWSGHCFTKKGVWNWHCFTKKDGWGGLCFTKIDGWSGHCFTKTDGWSGHCQKYGCASVWCVMRSCSGLSSTDRDVRWRWLYTVLVVDRFYYLHSADVRSLEDSLHSFHMWLSVNDCSLFIARFWHCTLFTCDCQWMTVDFLLHVFEYPPKWCTYSAIWLLHGWCQVKLLPSQRTFRVHYTTYSPVHSATSCKATHVGCLRLYL